MIGSSDLIELEAPPEPRSTTRPSGCSSPSTPSCRSSSRADDGHRLDAAELRAVQHQMRTGAAVPSTDSDIVAIETGQPVVISSDGAAVLRIALGAQLVSRWARPRSGEPATPDHRRHRARDRLDPPRHTSRPRRRPMSAWRSRTDATSVCGTGDRAVRERPRPPWRAIADHARPRPPRREVRRAGRCVPSGDPPCGRHQGEPGGRAVARARRCRRGARSSLLRGGRGRARRGLPAPAHRVRLPRQDARRAGRGPGGGHDGERRQPDRAADGARAPAPRDLPHRRAHHPGGLRGGDRHHERGRQRLALRRPARRALRSGGAADQGSSDHPRPPRPRRQPGVQHRPARGSRGPGRRDPRRDPWRVAVRERSRSSTSVVGSPPPIGRATSPPRSRSTQTGFGPPRRGCSTDRSS